MKRLIVSLIFIISNSLLSQEIEGLKAHWDFEGIENGMIIDKSGNGHDAIPHNSPQFVPGKKGNALKLNGSNFARILNERFLDCVCNITFSTWFMLEGNANRRCIMFSTSDDLRPTFFSVLGWKAPRF